jgi:hypothetical protein
LFVNQERQENQRNNQIILFLSKQYNIMSSALLTQLASNPAVQTKAKNIAGKASDVVTGGVLGGIGGLIAGKKGKRIGKTIAKGMNSVRKSLLGFESGTGKVRKVPMQVQGYNAGGVIVRPLPRPRPRKK